MTRTLGQVREQNTNLASFVAEMTEEVEGMVRRTDRMEEFMAQYGYKPTARVEVTKILPGDTEPTNKGKYLNDAKLGHFKAGLFRVRGQYRSARSCRVQ